MAIVRWRHRLNPLTDLVSLGDAVNRMFDDGFMRDFGGSTGIISRLNPAVDVVERDDEFVFLAELPGMDVNDVNLEYNDGMLTISGEKKNVTEKKENGYCRMEREYGRFERSFTLPTGINQENINAGYKAGILEIHVPKTEDTRSRRGTIQIKAE